MLIALPLGGAAMVPLGATASTPSSGVISGAAPTIWDFGPVEGVTGVSNVTGPVGQQCPPVLCDNYDLTVVLPQADTTFYATHTATMLIKYTWNSTLPTDMDIFAYAPDGTQSGPGNPDATSTGAGEEDLTLANPQSGLWHIRSLASTTPMPTSAHAVATLTFAAKGAPAAEPTVDFAHTAPMAFGPSTIVDPVFLSAEPQVNVERILPGSLPGAVDPKRIFVDWPLSTRTQTGQLHRSTDGGDSFRNLVDLTCAPRSRPNCITGGGGDTVARVNLIDGTVFFSDQEALANEALASSTDHGDSFPTARQSAVSNADTGVDRQWIAAVDAPAVTVGGAAAVPISGFLSYHIPGAGEYIQAINSTTGQPLPQPVTQLPLVGQSGPSRVDETGGPGTGWIYQSYRDFQGAQFQVGVAPVATYELPSAWKVNLVNTDSPLVFPWIALDSHGDLYAVWATNGNIYYAYSLIDDPLNNPLKGGTPATKWSHKWRVNPPGVGGSIFPEIVAGDPGRVAIVFFAAPGYVGDSSSSPATTAYNVYVAESVNGTDGNQPAMSVAQVNHRVAHLGNICTNGTTCVAQTSGQDRSLADMIDITTDQDGRASVIYTDNNSGLGNVADGTNLRSDPFAHFAKAVVGPS
ncbi:MAG TPA: hypothetical protein VG245_03815, partial [Candidatus Dormibacteraeota bacterium]|nr:hypothetical protein [Candidatus Dormibacteraeota bacterium]